MSAVIQADHLKKTFVQGVFKRKTVEAVKDVSFRVEAREIVGFIGPNGSGKTTTIKMLTGLIRPSSGTATLFDLAVPSPRAMQRVGFLPESPYIFPYLTPREYVEMNGALSGLRGQALRDRTTHVLKLTEVEYAGDRPVRRLSKGMGQRTALAAALVADPELLILDEPMSGLDITGRKHVRDLIIDERRQGRTIFFSTHILADVESICDHVVMLDKGNVVKSGAIHELLANTVLRTAVTIDNASDELEASFKQKLAPAGHSVLRRAGLLVVELEGASGVDDVLREALDAGARVAEIAPQRETLEQLFTRLTGAKTAR